MSRMNFVFDLQMFAEDDEHVDDNVNEGVVEEKAGNASGSKEENFEVPDELAGIPEDIAREIVAEHEQNQQSPEESDNNAEGNSSDSTAEDGSDNNHDDEELVPKEPIPYVRFKQQVDKNRQLEELVKNLQQRLESGSQGAVNQSAHEPNMQVVNVAQPQNQQLTDSTQQAMPILNDDVAAKIQQAIDSEAMQLSGVTAEEIAGFKYLDDDDKRKQTWETARRMAQNNVMQKIAMARQQQMEQSRRVIAQHNQAVLDYNSFAQKEFKDPEYKNIMQYATNEYFEKETGQTEQGVIAAAYSRIEHNTASPQDIALIKRYYTDAKNSYMARYGKSNSNKNNNVLSKVKQGKAFPRSSTIDGAGTDTGGVTIETLSKMLEDKPFDEIPKEYQEMLLGY